MKNTNFDKALRLGTSVILANDTDDTPRLISQSQILADVAETMSIKLSCPKQPHAQSLSDRLVCSAIRTRHGAKASFKNSQNAAILNASHIFSSAAIVVALSGIQESSAHEILRAEAEFYISKILLSPNEDDVTENIAAWVSSFSYLCPLNERDILDIARFHPAKDHENLRIFFNNSIFQS